MAQGDPVREIKDRLDIVEVISGYVRLQRAGRDHKGLCPFHAEKTPSFSVSTEKQVWYCFGCNQGGDLFDFVQKIEAIDFPQALQVLADRAGVTLEEHRGGKRRSHEREKARAANALASQYYHYVLTKLPAGGRGLRYLQKRGVDDETIERFQVGWAPAARRPDNLLRFLRSKGLSDDEAVKAGLAYREPAGDRFRARLMFPLSDETGQPVGFSGRALDSNPPKYLNTPTTSVYDKSRILFGLHLARRSISERGVAVLMEGQFDVLMAHQHGTDYAIASSGTAVTPEQVKLLRRFATELLLCLDSDDAGRHATQRAIEMASRAGLRVKVLELPNAKDPGEFFQRTPQLWDQVEGSALAGWEWWISGVLAEHNVRTRDGRARAARALVAVLSRIPEEASLDIYCQYAAERLRLDPALLLVDVQRYRKSGALPNLETAEVDAGAVIVQNGNGAAAVTSPEEDRLLALVLSNRDSWAILQELLGGEPLGTPELQELCARLVEVDASGSNLERHLERFTAEERTRLVRLSLSTTSLVDDRELRAALADCVDRIRLKTYETEMAALEDRLRDLASGEEDVREGLLHDIHRIAKRRVEVKTRLYQGQT